MIVESQQMMTITLKSRMIGKKEKALVKREELALKVIFLHNQCSLRIFLNAYKDIFAEADIFL